MPRLYLLRHAKSSWADPGLDDRYRPLTARGRKAARLASRYLEMEAITPDLVLCSPAQRCQETLDPLRAAFTDLVQIEIEEELYGAGSGDVLRRLRKVAPDTGSVMVIGHNPAIQELAVMLARNPEDLVRLRDKYPTAALATLSFPGEWKNLGETAAVLEEFVVPREPDPPREP
ncbi:MAG: SixA phosphatase family protein [Actinomycetota bacterium]